MYGSWVRVPAGSPPKASEKSEAFLFSKPHKKKAPDFSEAFFLESLSLFHCTDRSNDKLSVFVKELAVTVVVSAAEIYTPIPIFTVFFN